MENVRKKLKFVDQSWKSSVQLIRVPEGKNREYQAQIVKETMEKYLPDVKKASGLQMERALQGLNKKNE